MAPYRCRRDRTDIRRGRKFFLCAIYEGPIGRNDRELIKDLESKYPAQSRLFDVARGFLFKDRVAAVRVVQWLKVSIDAEPRGVAALRGFFEQRYGVKVSASHYRLTI